MKVYEQINETNWCKGSVNKGDRLCLVAWIYKVYGEYGGGANTCTRLRHAMIDRGLINNTNHIHSYNDNSEITIEDMIATCKEFDV